MFLMAAFLVVAIALIVTVDSIPVIVAACAVIMAASVAIHLLCGLAGDFVGHEGVFSATSVALRRGKEVHGTWHRASGYGYEDSHGNSVICDETTRYEYFLVSDALDSRVPLGYDLDEALEDANSILARAS